jgi:hypothetical protein
MRHHNAQKSLVYESANPIPQLSLLGSEQLVQLKKIRRLKGRHTQSLTG